MEIHVGLLEGLRSWILNVFYKGPSLGGVSAVTLGNLLAIAGAAAGFLRRDGNRPGAVPWELLVWPFLYFLFFTVTRSSYVLFTWYYLPVLPFLILFLSAGLDRFGGRTPAGEGGLGGFGGVCARGDGADLPPGAAPEARFRRSGARRPLP